MGLSISSALSSAVSSYTSAGQANAPQAVAQGATRIQLSEAQQVVQLYNQGQEVSQIASSLALPVETVNLYLGITSGG